MTSRTATASMSATATPIRSRSRRAVASQAVSLPVRKARVRAARAAWAVPAKRVVLAVASRKVRSRVASRVRPLPSTVRRRGVRPRVAGQGGQGRPGGADRAPQRGPRQPDPLQTTFGFANTGPRRTGGGGGGAGQVRSGGQPRGGMDGMPRRRSKG